MKLLDVLAQWHVHVISILCAYFPINSNLFKSKKNTVPVARCVSNSIPSLSRTTVANQQKEGYPS